MVLVDNDDWHQILFWDDLDDALAVINNWRSAHAYPLNAITTRLRERALRVSSQALVAQRLKRIEAIKFKLERTKKKAGRIIGLSSMQDIGGCRAVMPSVSDVEAMRDYYTRAAAEEEKRTRKRGSEMTRMDDYIRDPKSDGYRGVHFVYRYRSQTRSSTSADDKNPLERARFNGLKVEIQIRSSLQHQWASAVETAGRYTRQNIKGHAGDAKWARFFSLTGSAIAMIENRSLVPNTPTNRMGMIGELKRFQEQFEALRSFAPPRVMIRKGGAEGGDVYILVVDPDRGEVEARPFNRRRIVAAQEAYFSTEKTIRTLENVEAVLVGVNSEEQLKVAYPSYYLDSRDFLKTLDDFMTR